MKRNPGTMLAVRRHDVPLLVGVSLLASRNANERWLSYLSSEAEWRSRGFLAKSNASAVCRTDRRTL